MKKQLLTIAVVMIALLSFAGCQTTGGAAPDDGIVVSEERWREIVATYVEPYLPQLIEIAVAQDWITEEQGTAAQLAVGGVLRDHLVPCAIEFALVYQRIPDVDELFACIHESAEGELVAIVGAKAALASPV